MSLEKSPKFELLNLIAAECADDNTAALVGGSAVGGTCSARCRAVRNCHGPQCELNCHCAKYADTKLIWMNVDI